MASVPSLASDRRCCTWVAASAFCFCASRGFLARDSIAMVTNAPIRRPADDGVARCHDHRRLCLQRRSFLRGGRGSAGEHDGADDGSHRIRNATLRLAWMQRARVRPRKLMKLEQFAMERMQSTYENQVEFNLSESGVHPLTLGELRRRAPARRTRCSTRACATRSRTARPALRALVAAMYPGATPITSR